MMCASLGSRKAVPLGGPNRSPCARNDSPGGWEAVADWPPGCSKAWWDTVHLRPGCWRAWHGEVYRARDTLLGPDAALKILHH